jgi:hypothetical protein
MPPGRTASCHVGHTGTHLITEVKQRWAWIVLGWVITLMQVLWMLLEGVPTSCGLGNRSAKAPSGVIAQNDKYAGSC